MNISISKQDVLWSYLGYILKLCAGFFLLPVLLVKLSSAELGVWYIFLSFGALIQLLDLGFSPTIMRNISYAFAGAPKLQAEGISTEKLSGEPNYEMIAKLLDVSRKIYFRISLASLFLLIVIGSIYIYYITKEIENTIILIAWLIYSFGLFCNFYYSYWVSVLIGIGKIKESQKATVLSQLAYLGIAFTGLYFSGGLIAVSVAFLLSGFLLRLLCRIYFEKYIKSLPSVIIEQERTVLLQTIWYNAKKIGLVSLGAFLIVQANTLICSSFFELEIVASYGLTLQIITVLSSFSRVLFNTYLPTINEARIKQDVVKVKKEMSKTFLWGWIIYFVGAIVLSAWGNDLLTIIHSNTKLLDTNILIFMLVILFLEYNHSNFATMIVTKNEVPFVKVSLVSGIGVVGGSLVNILVFDLGLWGMLAAQFFVQLAYNNWYWPWCVMKDLQIGAKDIVILGINEACNGLNRR